MARGILLKEEIEQLKDNPYVLFVDENRIVYTNEFKHHFMNEYLSGKGPTQIFREAGFEPKILGTKRIERAAARWRESYAAGTLGKFQDGTVRHEQTMRASKKCNKDFVEIEKKYQEQLAEKQKEIEELQKQIRRLEELKAT